MNLTTDDSIYTVNNEYLGPPGYTFPWRARYVAYLIGGLLLFVVVGLERKLGIPLSIFPGLVWTVGVVVVVTRYLGRFIDFERPFRSLCVVFWHEVTAPRPLTRGRSARLRPGRVRFTEGPPRAEGPPAPLR